MNPTALLLLATWLVVCAVLAGPAVAMHLWLRERDVTDERVLIVAPLVFVGLLGYLAFFVFFGSAEWGKLFSVLVLVAAWIFRLRRLPGKHGNVWSDGLALPAFLAFGLGLFYLALLYLPELGRSYVLQSTSRYVHQLPVDPVLPQLLGDRLYAGASLHPFFNEWLSSDRPPLQSGLYLLVLPWLRLFRLPDDLGYQCLGTAAQLLWVPAAWLLARSFGLGRRRTTLSVLVVAMVGCFVLNTVYVWPKLLAAGYVVFTGVLLLDGSRPRSMPILALAGVSAALGWLAHGGAAFSLLALGPIWLLQRCPEWRKMPVVVAECLVLALPWLLYQRFCDPPGDRLLKWHLAGVIPVDPRSFPEVLRAAYAPLSWQAWLANKQTSLAVICGGSFAHVFEIFATSVKQRRAEEFFHLLRAFGILNGAWLLWPVMRLVRRGAVGNSSLGWSMVGWIIMTTLLWVLLMFEPSSTVLHQGSYASIIVACGLAAVLLLDLPVWLAGLVLGWHALYFVATWLPYFGSAPLNRGMFLIGALSAALLWRASRLVRQRDQPEMDPRSRHA